MANSESTGDGDYYAAISLAAEHTAAIVELFDDLISLKFVGPITTVSALLNRDETRTIALHLLDATQIDRAEED